MWQLVGQDRAVNLLQRNLEQGSVAHAYLVVGPPHVGKMTLALELAQALNCQEAKAPCGECEPCQRVAAGNHADVQVIGLKSQAKPVSSPFMPLPLRFLRVPPISPTAFYAPHHPVLIDRAADIWE